MDRHYAPLYSYVRFLTAHSADSEDILHQVFLIAYERLAADEPFEGNLEKWLRGTARHRVYAYWRDRKKLPQLLAHHLRILADEADNSHDEDAEEELKAALRQCLGKLRPDDRQLISMHYEEGVQVTGIARQAGKNLSALYVRLHRIRQTLKRCVEAVSSGGGAI